MCLFPAVESVSSLGRPPALVLSLGADSPAVQPPEAGEKDKHVSRLKDLHILTQVKSEELKQNGPNLLVLALVVLQGGQVSKIALQSLNTLLVLPLQLRLLLTLLLQVVDVLVSTADLHKKGNVVW